jgi:hypothetical protein
MNFDEKYIKIISAQKISLNFADLERIIGATFVS